MKVQSVLTQNMKGLLNLPPNLDVLELTQIKTETKSELPKPTVTAVMPPPAVTAAVPPPVVSSDLTVEEAAMRARIEQRKKELAEKKAKEEKQMAEQATKQAEDAKRVADAQRAEEAQEAAKKLAAIQEASKKLEALQQAAKKQAEEEDAKRSALERAKKQAEEAKKQAEQAEQAKKQAQEKANTEETVLFLATVLYDFPPKNERELRLKKGEIVKVKQVKDEWSFGALQNGNEGWFPSNYIERIQTAAQPQPPTTTNTESTVSFFATVLFDFPPENERELRLKKGERVEVKQVIDEWSFGVLPNGKEGWFPSNYIERINPQPKPQPQQPTTTNAYKITTTPATTNTTTPRSTTTYTPATTPKSSTLNTPKSAPPAATAGTTQKQNSKPSFTKGLFGGKKKEPSSSKKVPEKAPEKVTTPHKPVCYFARVKFDFPPENERELELKQGDMVEVLQVVDEWWFGCLPNGREGYFPGNYVEKIGDW